MLRGQALDHYHINDRNTNQADISFNDLCHFTRNYFEGPEYRRNCQTKWDEASLQSTINNNAGKSTFECLQLLITELRRLQHDLHQSLQSDIHLYDKLIRACRNVPACKPACFKPSNTLIDLINDFQSSIITYEKPHDISDTFFTDRRFRKQRPQTNVS